MNVIGFDAWIEHRTHETAAAALVQPNILPACKRDAKIPLRNGIEPLRLQERACAAVAVFHHELDERANMSWRVAGLWRSAQPTARVSAHEVVDHFEGQIGTRHGLVGQIQGTTQDEWRPQQGTISLSDSL